MTRTTAVEALTASLRRQVLDGDLAPGTPLREQRLSDEAGVARHTVRAALRALVAEGLATLEPHRGVRVRGLRREDLEALGELRVALEVEGARLALARGGGRLPAEVRAAGDAFAAVCAEAATAQAAPPSAAPTGASVAPGASSTPSDDDNDGATARVASWAAVTDAHEALHHAIVRAAQSPRIAAAHAALAAEQRLFLAGLRPDYDLPELAAQHAALLDAIDAEGPDALREHVAASTALLAARLA